MSARAFVTLAAFLSAAACGPRAAPPSAAVPSPPRFVPGTISDPIDVAITVDDLPRHGPDLPGVTRLAIHEQLLAAFKKHHLPPVYGFLNAQRLEEHPEDRAALTAWTRAGFPLGNHTYSHIDIFKHSLPEYLADVDKNEVALKELMGDTTEARHAWKVFRYPYLREGNDVAQRAVLRAELVARGYRIAEVTIDFYDWAYNEPYARCSAKGDTKAIDVLKESYVDHAAWALRWADAAARELLGRPAKQVLLLHAGVFDAFMLDELLTTYEKNGAHFISLDEALTDPVYAEEPKQPKTHFGNLFNQIRKSRATRSPALPPPPDALLDLVCR